MRAGPRFLICGALALCVGTAVSFPAQAKKHGKHTGKISIKHGELQLRNAQAETLDFASLNGWKDDDHAAAYDAFVKSCNAILRGSKAMRAARPVYGALFNVCERSKTAGPLAREQARAFFEANFKPVRLAPPGRARFLHRLLRNRSRGSRVKTAEFNVRFTPRRRRQ